MTGQTPAHRQAAAPRSGDTIVIGADGEAVNVDAEARDASAGTFLASVVAPVLDDDGHPLNPPAGNLTDPPGVITPPRGRKAPDEPGAEPPVE